MTEYRYTKDHEWVSLENNRVRVGISDFAQSELGDIAFVELPEVGKEIKQGEPVCSVDSLKSFSEIFAPVSGKIVEVNKRLEREENCGIINTDPLGEGWIFVIEISEPKELNTLLSSIEYRQFIQEDPESKIILCI